MSYEFCLGFFASTALAMSAALRLRDMLRAIVFCQGEGRYVGKGKELQGSSWATLRILGEMVARRVSTREITGLDSRSLGSTAHRDQTKISLCSNFFFISCPSCLKPK
jgi:hypothetical protein